MRKPYVSNRVARPLDEAHPLSTRQLTLAAVGDVSGVASESDVSSNLKQQPDFSPAADLEPVMRSKRPPIPSPQLSPTGRPVSVSRKGGRVRRSSAAASCLGGTSCPTISIGMWMIIIMFLMMTVQVLPFDVVFYNAVEDSWAATVQRAANKFSSESAQRTLDRFLFPTERSADIIASTLMLSQVDSVVAVHGGRVSLEGADAVANAVRDRNYGWLRPPATANSDADHFNLTALCLQAYYTLASQYNNSASYMWTNISDDVVAAAIQRCVEPYTAAYEDAITYLNRRAGVNTSLHMGQEEYDQLEAFQQVASATIFRAHDLNWIAPLSRIVAAQLACTTLTTASGKTTSVDPIAALSSAGGDVVFSSGFYLSVWCERAPADTSDVGEGAIIFSSYVTLPAPDNGRLKGLVREVYAPTELANETLSWLVRNAEAGYAFENSAPLTHQSRYGTRVHLDPPNGVVVTWRWATEDSANSVAEQVPRLNETKLFRTMHRAAQLSISMSPSDTFVPFSASQGIATEAKQIRALWWRHSYPLAPTGVSVPLANVLHHACIGVPLSRSTANASVMDGGSEAILTATAMICMSRLPIGCEETYHLTQGLSSLDETPGEQTAFQLDVDGAIVTAATGARLPFSTSQVQLTAGPYACTNVTQHFKLQSASSFRTVLSPHMVSLTFAMQPDNFTASGSDQVSWDAVSAMDNVTSPIPFGTLGGFLIAGASASRVYPPAAQFLGSLPSNWTDLWCTDAAMKVLTEASNLQSVNPCKADASLFTGSDRNNQLGYSMVFVAPFRLLIADLVLDGAIDEYGHVVTLMICAEVGVAIAASIGVMIVMRWLLFPLRSMKDLLRPLDHEIAAKMARNSTQRSRTSETGLIMLGQNGVMVCSGDEEQNDDETASTRSDSAHRSSSAEGPLHSLLSALRWPRELLGEKPEARPQPHLETSALQGLTRVPQSQDWDRKLITCRATEVAEWISEFARLRWSAKILMEVLRAQQHATDEGMSTLPPSGPNPKESRLRTINSTTNDKRGITPAPPLPGSKFDSMESTESWRVASTRPPSAVNPLTAPHHQSLASQQSAFQQVLLNGASNPGLQTAPTVPSAAVASHARSASPVAALMMTSPSPFPSSGANIVLHVNNTVPLLGSTTNVSSPLVSAATAAATSTVVPPIALKTFTVALLRVQFPVTRLHLVEREIPFTSIAVRQGALGSAASSIGSNTTKSTVIRSHSGASLRNSGDSTVWLNPLPAGGINTATGRLPHPSPFEYLGVVAQEAAKHNCILERIVDHQELLISCEITPPSSMEGCQGDEAAAMAALEAAASTRIEVAVRCAAAIVKAIHDVYFTATPEWVAAQAVQLIPAAASAANTSGNLPPNASPIVAVAVDYGLMHLESVAHDGDVVDTNVMGDAVDRTLGIHEARRLRPYESSILLSHTAVAQLLPSSPLLKLLCPLDVIEVRLETGIPRKEVVVLHSLLDPVALAVGEGRTFSPAHQPRSAEEQKMSLKRMTEKIVAFPSTSGSITVDDAPLCSLVELLWYLIRGCDWLWKQLQLHHHHHQSNGMLPRDASPFHYAAPKSLWGGDTSCAPLLPVSIDNVKLAMELYMNVAISYQVPHTPRHTTSSLRSARSVSTSASLCCSSDRHTTSSQNFSLHALNAPCPLTFQSSSRSFFQFVSVLCSAVEELVMFDRLDEGPQPISMESTARKGVTTSSSSSSFGASPSAQPNTGGKPQSLFHGAAMVTKPECLHTVHPVDVFSPVVLAHPCKTTLPMEPPVGDPDCLPSAVEDADGAAMNDTNTTSSAPTVHHLIDGHLPRFVPAWEDIEGFQQHQGFDVSMSVRT